MVFLNKKKPNNLNLNICFLTFKGFSFRFFLSFFFRLVVILRSKVILLAFPSGETLAEITTRDNPNGKLFKSYRIFSIHIIYFMPPKNIFYSFFLFLEELYEMRKFSYFPVSFKENTGDGMLHAY